jgi:hypothetical protein
VDKELKKSETKELVFNCYRIEMNYRKRKKNYHIGHESNRTIMSLMGI